METIKKKKRVTRLMVIKRRMEQKNLWDRLIFQSQIQNRRMELRLGLLIVLLFSWNPSSTTKPGDSSPSSSIFGFNIAPPKPSENPESNFSVNLPEKVEAVAPQPTEPVKTGEENENHVFQTKAKLFTMDSIEKKWKESGVGTLRLNVALDGSIARLVMRNDGSLRLLLNVKLWPGMKVEKAADKQVRFTGTTFDTGKPCTYLVKFARPESAEELIQSIENNKSIGANSQSSLKKPGVPENTETTNTEKPLEVEKKTTE